MKTTIERTNFELLAEQKIELQKTINHYQSIALRHGSKGNKEKYEHWQKKTNLLTGLLHFIDNIQDEAVDSYGYPEGKVFPNLEK